MRVGRAATAFVLIASPGRVAQAKGVGSQKMKLLNRILGRGRYHFGRGDHWFPLAVIALGIGIVAVVLLY